MGLPPVVRVTVNGSGADKGGISNVRVSTLLPFPVTVKGTGGFKVVKNPGGNWVVSPDFGALANVPVLADIINKLVWFYDQADKTYKTASLQAIITALAIAADPDLQAAIAAAQAAQAAAETAQSGAETAESDASTSATAAATSASSAATSESNAATSETNSAASASAASSSASAAATSETNASASATSAASHDTAAAASATAADTAKTAAQTAQTGAEAAQTAVEALLSASKVMLILDHVPTSGDGDDGWLAVDTSTARYPVYGPKASGSWGGIVGYMIGQDGTGTGDMSKSTYDPNNVAADAFSQDNMADGTTNKNYSATDKTKLSGIEASADVTDAGNVGSSIHGATGKTTPADADELALIDSAASNVLKKLTWANLKATLSSLFISSSSAPSGSIVGTTDAQTLTNKTLTNPIVGTQSQNDNSTKAASTAYVDRTVREKLTANRTYYVDATNGSDSNTGLASGSGNAFQTIQKAINVIATLDIATFAVTIQLADGTYTGSNTVNGPWLGSGNVTVNGNTSTPANVIISVIGAPCFKVTNGGRLTLSGMEFRTATSGECLRATVNGFITLGTALRFGSCAAQHIYSDIGGVVQCFSDYSIVGSATMHIFCEAQGQVGIFPSAVTLSGTPAWGTAYIQAQTGGFIDHRGMTFSGSATGKRYAVLNGGIINSGGAGTSFYPGNSAGTGTTPATSPYGLYI